MRGFQMLGVYIDLDIEPEHIMIFVVVMLMIGVISAIILAGAKRREVTVNNAQPLRKEFAMVVDKEQVPPGTIMFGNPWVLFELNSGSRVRVRVSPSQNHLVIGDTGMLTWRGERLISFNRATGWAQTTAAQIQQGVPVQQNNQEPPATPETIFCIKCGRKQRKSNATCWACGANLHE